MKRLLILLAVLIALVWSAWYIAIPKGTIEEAIQSSISAGDISAEVVGLRKGLFMSFYAEGLDILAGGETLLGINDFSARLDPSGVAGLKAVIPFEGSIAGGQLSGLAEFGRDSRDIEARVSGADIARLGLYERTGLKGKGNLDGKLKVKGHRGNVGFSVSDIRLEPARLFGIMLPLERLRAAEGTVNFSVGILEIDNISFRGEGIGAEVTGEIIGGVANLEVQVTVEDPGSIDPLLSALLEKYTVSPGHYVVPIKAKTGEIFTDVRS